MRTEINAKALANTARECIKMASAKNQTIAKIIAHWNLCVNQSGFTGSYDFPTEGYSRKAQLITELENCAEQLDAFAFQALIETQRAAGLPVDEEGNDTREWCGNDIEEAHAEGLSMNCAIDFAGVVVRSLAGMEIEWIMVGICDGMFISGHDDVPNLSSTALRVEINRAHDEALKEDYAITAERAENRGVDFFSQDEFTRQCSINFAFDEAMAYDMQRDFYALSWDAQLLAVENAEDEARVIEYCNVAMDEGAGGLTGYVIEVAPGKYLDLSAHAATTNPLKASYFEPDEYKDGKMKQFCMNGEKAVTLGDAVMDVAFNIYDYRR